MKTDLFHLRCAAEAVYISVPVATADHLNEIITSAANEIEALREENKTLRAQSVVPAGWKLVPETPSNAMLVNAELGSTSQLSVHGGLREHWRLMLDAVPYPKESM